MSKKDLVKSYYGNSSSQEAMWFREHPESFGVHYDPLNADGVTLDDAVKKVREDYDGIIPDRILDMEDDEIQDYVCFMSSAITPQEVYDIYLREATKMWMKEMQS